MRATVDEKLTGTLNARLDASFRTVSEQLMNVHDQPFAAALSVIMMLMMTVMIAVYRRVTGSGEMEGMI